MLLDVEQTPMSNNSQLETILSSGVMSSRVLLDVEQTLKNRPLSYVECC